MTVPLKLWLTCEAEASLGLRPQVGPDGLQVWHFLEPAHFLPALCQTALTGGVCPAKQEGAAALDPLRQPLSHRWAETHTHTRQLTGKTEHASSRTL